jgi:hypothetical protein
MHDEDIMPISEITQIIWMELVFVICNKVKGEGDLSLCEKSRRKDVRGSGGECKCIRNIGIDRGE